MHKEKVLNKEAWWRTPKCLRLSWPASDHGVDLEGIESVDYMFVQEAVWAIDQELTDC